MPLELLLILVLGGIAGIAGLLHVLGKSARTVLDANSARAAWVRQFPDTPVDDVSVSRDGHAALVRTRHGMGLVWAFGADTVARRLQDFELAAQGTALRVRFHDYTAPGVTLHQSPHERDTWQSLMRPRT